MTVVVAPVNQAAMYIHVLSTPSRYLTPGASSIYTVVVLTLVLILAHISMLIVAPVMYM